MSADEGKSDRGVAWREAREAFRQRHKAAGDTTDELTENDDRASRVRNRSRPRARARPTCGADDARELPRSADSDSCNSSGTFNQQAFLEQDRALIERLQQRQPRREGSVRKPPPPPRVTPYRPGSARTSPSSVVDTKVDVPCSSSVRSPAQESAASVCCEGETVLSARATPTRTTSEVPISERAVSTSTALCVGASRQVTQNGKIGDPESCACPGCISGSDCIGCLKVVVPQLKEGEETVSRKAVRDQPSRQQNHAKKVLCDQTAPIVPRCGSLFTASDIDSIMDRLGQGVPLAQPTISACEPRSGCSAVHTAEVSTPQAERVADDTGLTDDPQSEGTHNFKDFATDFFESHNMEVTANRKSKKSVPATENIKEDFVVPDRKALHDRINGIDSWLEEDYSARERLGAASSATKQDKPNAPLHSFDIPPTASPDLADPVGLGGGAVTITEAEIFKELEDAKRRKALGEQMSPVTLKNTALQAKPLFPGMSLEKLVHMLRLFTSARYEDHDLYLRILGEIPLQLRGIPPEMLTTVLRVLWRLRLQEETYLELFSMEAMNMVRAQRKPAPRTVRAFVSRNAASTTGAAATTAPPPSPPESPAPFSLVQLVHIGNSLSRLGAKHSSRFMDVFQEQLARAIPLFGQLECELVCPTFAMSQLLHDPLRRLFLERCMEVDAGKPFEESHPSGNMPDIAQYQRDAEQRRRRLKHFRNIYIIEASVRKETFSFFTSLPADVRAYLDRLRDSAGQLSHEGAIKLSLQVSNVLDQLGVTCNTSKMVGPLSLHVVAKATNPHAAQEDVVYECTDTAAYYALHQDQTHTELTAPAKLRHKLLQRLGVKLTHISVWEWQQKSEAQRINHMVKLQSLQ